MIYSLVGKRIEDVPEGGFATGVVRFDTMLRRVFPDLVSVTPAVLRSAERPIFDPREDVVIADNHLSVHISPEVPCVVVHHGCGQTHFDRVPAWQNDTTRQLCEMQRKMFTLPNRVYVAPSSWVRKEFARHYDLREWYADEIINWVPRIERPERTARTAPLIIAGDWRDENKGAPLWARIARRMPEAEFRTCHFTTEAERIAFYQAADAYLCLSQSEGGSYAMCDAEAAGLTIYSTPVGNADDFAAWLLPRTDDPDRIVKAIREAPRTRAAAPYFETYDFEHWAELWRGVVAKARHPRGALL